MPSLLLVIACSSEITRVETVTGETVSLCGDLQDQGESFNEVLQTGGYPTPVDAVGAAGWDPEEMSAVTMGDYRVYRQPAKDQPGVLAAYVVVSRLPEGGWVVVAEYVGSC